MKIDKKELNRITKKYILSVIGEEQYKEKKDVVKAMTEDFKTGFIIGFKAISDYINPDAELQDKIEECEHLHSLLSNRPIEVELHGSLVDYENHVEKSELIIGKLENNDLIYAYVKIDESAVEVQVIKHDDLIFYGITIATINGANIPKNKLVEFQSCDIFQIFDGCSNEVSSVD